MWMRGEQGKSEIVQWLQKAFNGRSTAESRAEEASLVEKSGRSDSNGVRGSGVEEKLEVAEVKLWGCLCRKQG